MEKKKYQVIVLGGGPGGYVAAIRAQQRGLSVALVESLALGGTCLNRGCIPSKALLAGADVLRKVKEAGKFGITTGEVSFDYAKMKERSQGVVDRMRKGLEGLIASNKISLFPGFGKFISPKEIKVNDKEILEGEKIIIATGSEPKALPQFPFDQEVILDSTAMLSLSTLPKKLVIVGGGVIGCEFASLHAELGVDVTILEVLPTILSTETKNVVDALALSFKRRGIKIETAASITSIEKNGGEAIITLLDGRVFTADKVLISVGRKFNSDQLGLEKAGVIVEKNGSIPVTDRMLTNVPDIYAIGDVTGKWILAHVASHQGIVAADNAYGHALKMSYKAIPNVIFTHPEIASVGLTIEKALELGIDAKVGKFPFLALGKAQAAIETEGFCQIVIAASTKEILGAQVVGYGASTLIAEMALAIQNELTVEAVAETIHAHPTLSEAWLEAALLSLEMPLHMPPKRG